MINNFLQIIDNSIRPFNDYYFYSNWINGLEKWFYCFYHNLSKQLNENSKLIFRFLSIARIYFLYLWQNSYHTPALVRDFGVLCLYVRGAWNVVITLYLYRILLSGGKCVYFQKYSFSIILGLIEIISNFFIYFSSWLHFILFRPDLLAQSNQKKNFQLVLNIIFFWNLFKKFVFFGVNKIFSEICELGINNFVRY